MKNIGISLLFIAEMVLIGVLLYTLAFKFEILLLPGPAFALIVLLAAAFHDINGYAISGIVRTVSVMSRSKNTIKKFGLIKSGIYFDTMVFVVIFSAMTLFELFPWIVFSKVVYESIVENIANPYVIAGVFWVAYFLVAHQAYREFCKELSKIREMRKDLGKDYLFCIAATESIKSTKMPIISASQRFVLSIVFMITISFMVGAASVS